MIAACQPSVRFGGNDDVESWELMPFYGEIRFHLYDSSRNEPAIGVKLQQVTGLRLVEMVAGEEIWADNAGLIVVHQLIRGTDYVGNAPPDPTFTFGGDGFQERMLSVDDLAEISGLDPYSAADLATVKYEGSELPVYEIQIHMEPLESAQLPSTPTTPPTREVVPTAEPVSLRIYESESPIRDWVWFDGKIWTATEDGVFAWDVDSGTSVSYAAEQGLPDNLATRLAVCPLPDPTLVVATQGGWALFDSERDWWGDIQPIRDRMNELDALTFGRGLPDMRVLACDPATNWLLFGSTTLYRLDMGSGEIDNFGKAQGSPLEFIDDVAVVGEEIWMASQLGGVAVVRDEEIFPLEDGDLGLIAAIKLAPAPDGTLWIGTPQGLVRRQDGEVVLWLGKSTAASGPFVPYIAQDGKLWVDLYQKNVCRLNPGTKECDLLLTVEDGLPDAVITGFIEDDAGNLYIRTADSVFARWGR